MQLTQEMIKAGTKALYQFYRDIELDGVFAEAAVKAVWAAMSGAKSQKGNDFVPIGWDESCCSATRTQMFADFPHTPSKAAAHPVE